MRIKVILSLFCWMVSWSAWSQGNDPVKENMIEKLIESISENTDNEIDYTAIIEDLNYYYDNPINLNQATSEELGELMILSEYQINSLYQYIKRHGQLLTIYEIQYINGWDNETVYLILPFVTVEPVSEKRKTPLKNVFKYGKNEVIARYVRTLEPQLGFIQNDTNPTAGYLGDPYQLFMRYRFTYKDKLSFGFTGRKDRGEEFFKGSNPYGFDFYSFHVFIKDITIEKWKIGKEPFKIAKLAIGDYQLQFGQGLTLWSGLAFRKTGFALNVKRFPVGLKQYTAANQFNYNRGIGVETRLGPVSVTGFFSYKFIDGNLNGEDTLTGEALEASSFLETGFHRTLNEIAQKNAIGELMTGGNVMYRAKKFNIGFTGVYTQYTKPLNLGDDPYNLYRFEGDRNANFGIDYNLLLGRFYLFGEGAISQNGGLAMTQGVTANLHDNFAMVVLFRNFSKEYQNVNANAFSDRFGVQNEQGLYIGFESTPVKKIKVQGFFDMFKFPWLRFGVDAPSDGFDYLAQISYIPNRRLETYFRVRGSRRQENSSMDDDYIDPLVNIYRTNYRFNVTFEVSKELKLRNRIELTTLEQADRPYRTGFMVYQDIIYKPSQIPLDVTARIALFETDDFDTRIYTYENDVLYSFSVPGLFYRGMRWYLNLKYEITRDLDVWFRISQTYLQNRSEIGSGLDLINGNTRTEIKVQVKYRFGFAGKRKPYVPK